MALFWIVFLLIYLFTRLFIRLMNYLRRTRLFSFDCSKTRSKEKICQAFVISSNDYGSFRPRQYFPSPLIYRSDSFFSNDDYHTSTTQLSKCESSPIHQATLLQHYLQTYNPLQIDHPTPPSPMPSEDTSHESRTMIHCYPLRRYTRLQEEACSQSGTTINSAIDEQCSECSTHVTRMTESLTYSSKHERCQRDMRK